MLVIVRPPGAAFRDAISNNPNHARIDVARAQRQHAAFCTELEDSGITLLRLREEPLLPDAIFVSDTLVALAPLDGSSAHSLVVGRPAIASRRPEVESVVAAALPHSAAGTRVVRVAEPGTLEGGDVVIYGDRIAIRGNLHAHNTLLRGSPEDVEAEARQCIESAGQGGGFILASGDGVIVGTPFENVFRMVEAGEKYGRYV